MSTTSTIPMLANIKSQPESHAGVLGVHSGQTQLAACAETIRNAKGRILFTAMGGSYFASHAAVCRLREQGYAAELTDSAELLHYGAATLRAGDVGIVVSRSGGSIEPVLLAEKMRQAGMTVIAVTNVPGSRLEEIAHTTLNIGARADKFIAVQTYTGTVLALMLLAEQVTSGSSAELSDACHAALPTLGAHIEHCLQSSDSWQSWLTPAPVYFLGRGAALGSAGEGALLLHETAKVPAVSMSSGQFRHGPAEILSGQFCAVVFGWPGATRNLELSLAHDIHTAGAQVRWIGPGQGLESSITSLSAWTDVPESLAPLFDIVPMQVAAYRLALWRGVTPGDFRYVTEVTASESGLVSSAASHGKHTGEAPSHA